MRRLSDGVFRYWQTRNGMDGDTVVVLLLSCMSKIEDILFSFFSSHLYHEH